MIKVLYFADIVGKIGRRAVVQFLSDNKAKMKPDLIIANTDNISAGRGPTVKAYQELDEAGIDVMTCGDHIWDYEEVLEILNDTNTKLIRPYNYPDLCSGKGLKEVMVKGVAVTVVSMLGRVWTREGLESPFTKTDEILQDNRAPIVIVDFHAEATSEKYAYGWDFAGKMSAIIGSHTHVQTADARILENYTGYISDAGFCGPKDSVIGVVPEQSIQVFRSAIKSNLDVAKGEAQINALVLEIDEKTGRTVKIEPISV